MGAYLLQNKQTDDVWFVGIYSNNYEDNEQEIITKQAHLDYLSFVRKNNITPPIILFHLPDYPEEVHMANLIGLAKGIFTPEQYNDNILTLYKSTAIAKAEYIVEIAGFMVVLGKVFKNKIPIVTKYLSKTKQYGMSHGFLCIKEGNLITKYFSHEFTVLPQTMAANKLTAIQFKNNEDNNIMDGLNTEGREFLEEVLGSEGAESLESGIQRLKAILDEVIASKSLEGESTEEVVEETPEVETPEEEIAVEETPEEEVEEEEIVESEEKSLDYNTMRNQLVEDFNLEGLLKAITDLASATNDVSKRLETLEGTVKALQIDEDTKVANQFTTFDWTMGVANSKSIEPDDAVALLEQVKQFLPGGIQDNKNSDVMQLGLWNVLGANGNGQ